MDEQYQAMVERQRAEGRTPDARRFNRRHDELTEREAQNVAAGLAPSGATFEDEDEPPRVWERVAADDVKVGDWIARTRTALPQQVQEIGTGPISVYFELGDRSRIRPRRSAQLWKVVG